MNSNSMRPSAEVLALQMNAERAGFAWACPFSSSDEFEAAVIRSRLRARACGRKRQYRFALLIAGTAAILGASCFLFV
jgi:hypothetical protein